MIVYRSKYFLILQANISFNKLKRSHALHLFTSNANTFLADFAIRRMRGEVTKQEA